MKKIIIKLFDYNELNEIAQERVKKEFFKDGMENMNWWEYVTNDIYGIVVKDYDLFKKIEGAGLISQNKWEDKDKNIWEGTFSYDELETLSIDLDLDNDDESRELMFKVNELLSDFKEAHEFSKYDDDSLEYFEMIIQEEWYQFLEDGTRYYGDEEEEVTASFSMKELLELRDMVDRIKNSLTDIVGLDDDQETIEEVCDLVDDLMREIN